MRVLAIVQEADAGPGVFAEAAAARGDELEEWLIAEGGDPPADPHGYDAVMVFGGAMNVDEEGEHPWLADQKALLRELLDARVPLLGVCLGAQLAGRGGGGGAAARAAAGDRVGTGRADPRRPRGPAARRPSHRLQRLPVAQLRDGHRRRRGAGAERGLRPGGAVRAPRLVDPVPRRGQRARRAEVDRRLRVRPRRGRDRARPRGARGRNAGEDRRLERGRPRALRPLPRARRRRLDPRLVD